MGFLSEIRNRAVPEPDRQTEFILIMVPYWGIVRHTVNTSPK